MLPRMIAILVPEEYKGKGKGNAIRNLPLRGIQVVRSPFRANTATSKGNCHFNSILHR